MIIKVTLEIESKDPDLADELERELREARGGVATLNAPILKEWNISFPVHSDYCALDPCDCGLLK